MIKKEYLKIILPIAAVLVIVESVVLVNSLTKKRNETMNQTTGIENNGGKVGSEEAVMELVFATDSKTMEVGKPQKVELNLMGKETRYLDAIDIYIKYDPKVMTISGLENGFRLPKPTFGKVSESKGIVVANFLINEPKGGMRIGEGEVVTLLSFDVKPLKEGEYNLSIGTGEDGKEMTTMFVENASIRALPFSSNKLTVKVTK